MPSLDTAAPMPTVLNTDSRNITSIHAIYTAANNTLTRNSSQSLRDQAGATSPPTMGHVMSSIM